MNNSTTKIGFVGLGNMGFPMAGRLAAAGYTLFVCDLNEEAVDRFCKEHDAARADLASLGSQADVVITMLPEGKAVRRVLMDTDAVADNLGEGAIIIDMSSCSPVDTRQLAADLAEKGLPLIDAPVSGGVVKAIDGSLAIMAGGDSSCVEQVRPVLENLGKVFPTGGPGTGHAMKAINNYLSAATLAVTSEAVLIGEQFGLDRTTMVDIINASTGRSNSSEHKFPTFILNDRFNSGFFLGLMAKDLRFAVELGKTTGSPHKLLEDVSSLWDEAEASLGFSADNTDVYRHLENQRDK